MMNVHLLLHGRSPVCGLLRARKGAVGVAYRELGIWVLGVVGWWGTGR